MRFVHLNGHVDDVDKKKKLKKLRKNYKLIIVIIKQYFTFKSQ